jgi:hypothetical protein
VQYGNVEAFEEAEAGLGDLARNQNLLGQERRLLSSFPP